MTIPFSADDIDALLFDMDGTLIETDDSDVAAWARRFGHVHRSPDKANSAARKFVMAMETPVNSAFTLLDWVGLDTPVVRLLMKLQDGTENQHLIPPIDGVVPMLERLAERYTLGVVSTRTSAESDRFLRAMGVREQIEVIGGRDTTWRIKPHPQPVKDAAKKLGLDPLRCLMVGDTTVDIKSGIRAGAWTCGVLCGYGQRTELERAGADLILSSTAHLEQILLNTS